ncbi:copper homeostasis protein CutC [Actinacidiphila glaucinigra]|uniref:copper homeostasis protein CutC n=1 Tax=Actinacidiphila glaucinigra TaxID=235986 RepID=UPI002E33C80A|nr:copper homeostasis protein CutC [Actinacidiphila glaucinigra]
MSRPIFEVIALDAHDALAARTGGADRLELVTDMAADGLTPSRETFAAVRAAVDIPVRVMLRARADFAVGGAREADALCAAVAALRGEGADEFVLGFLDGSGAPDLAAVRRLVDAIGPGARWTFHRALDHSADREAVRSAVRGLPGLDTFLTAGSAHGVDDGLGRLLAEAGRPGEPQLMVGGGLRAEHLPRLLAAGIDAFHVGGAVRPGGWAGAVDARAVRTWRELLDAPVAVP